MLAYPLFQKIKINEFSIIRGKFGGATAIGMLLIKEIECRTLSDFDILDLARTQLGM